MTRLIFALLVVAAVGCKYKDESSAKTPVTDAELKSLLAKQPNDGCTTYQVVDGPDGKKTLRCVEAGGDAGP